MKISLEQAMQLGLDGRKEHDKSALRRDGENAFYTNFKKKEQQRVNELNQLYAEAIAEAFSLDDTKVPKFKPIYEVCGIKLHDYVEMLKAEIAEEDVKNQQ